MCRIGICTECQGYALLNNDGLTEPHIMMVADGAGPPCTSGLRPQAVLHPEDGEEIVLDISHCERTPDGDYILVDALAAAAIADVGFDFQVKTSGQYVRSIGQFSDSSVVASLTNRFYDDPPIGSKCIWLR